MADASAASAALTYPAMSMPFTDVREQLALALQVANDPEKADAAPNVSVAKPALRKSTSPA